MRDRLSRLTRAERAIRRRDEGQGRGQARLILARPAARRCHRVVPMAEAVVIQGESCAIGTVSCALMMRSSGGATILGSGDRFHPEDCWICGLEASSRQNDSMIESTAFDLSEALEPCARRGSRPALVGPGRIAARVGYRVEAVSRVCRGLRRVGPIPGAPESPLGFSLQEPLQVPDPTPARTAPMAKPVSTAHPA